MYNRNVSPQLAEQHGVGTYLHFIRRLIVHSQGRLAANVTFDNSTALTFQLLVQETQRLARDPYLADRFRESVDKGEGDVFRNFDLNRFVDRVGLRPLEQLILASSFVSSSAQLSRKELEGQAAAIIRIEFEDAAVSLCQPVSFEHGDLNPSQLAKLMENLLLGPLDDPVLDAAQRQALIVAAQAKFGPEVISPILHLIFPSIS
jgi:CCR4-NOT transcription complex subunit 1